MLARVKRPWFGDSLRTLVVLVVYLSASGNCPERGEAADSSPTKAAKADAKQIERLIDQLAGSKVRFEGVREDRIWEAADALLELGDSAFPQLIAHFDDNRFSFSEDAIASRGPREKHQREVGYLCRQIVKKQVQKYTVADEPDPRPFAGYSLGVVPKTKGEAQAWLKQNAGKKLWELQVENLKFVIADHKEGLAMEQDQKRRATFEKLIKANEEMMKDLQKRQTPLPTKPVRPAVSK